MICAFFLFCSLIVPGTTVPDQMGQVGKFTPAPNVILAHNYLDGSYFSQLQPGNVVHVDDAGWKSYRVREVIEAQALHPESDTTPLWIDGAWRDPAWVWVNVYWNNDLVLQTCVYRADLWTWGRLFVIADRVTE